MAEFSHAIIFVSDMARSVAFYRDVLGLPSDSSRPSGPNSRRREARWPCTLPMFPAIRHQFPPRRSQRASAT